MVLMHGVPWQAALAGALAVSAAFLFTLFTGLAAGYFGLAWLVVLSQLASLLLVLLLIPVMLNLSRSFYGYLLVVYFAFVFVSILQYALLFQNTGLLSAAGTTSSLRDAIYFSVTTWTTLGYGDLTAEPNMRLATSAEAMTGTISIAIGVAFFWLYVTEQLVSKDRAVMDGMKFHTSSLTWHHMRVWSFGNRLRRLDPSYIDPPATSSTIYFDKEKQRWELLPPGTEPPPDTDTVRFGGSAEQAVAADRPKTGSG